MRLAWLEDGRIRDIAHVDPSSIYHPDVAKFYNVEVPDEATNGDWFAEGILTLKPVALLPELAPPPPRTISAEQVRQNLTMEERVKWDNNLTPEIVTAKIEFAIPRLEVDAAEVLDLLKNNGSISSNTKAKVLEGFI